MLVNSEVVNADTEENNNESKRWVNPILPSRLATTVGDAVNKSNISPSVSSQVRTITKDIGVLTHVVTYIVHPTQRIHSFQAKIGDRDIRDASVTGKIQPKISTLRI